LGIKIHPGILKAINARKKWEKSMCSMSQSIPFISGSDIMYSAVMIGFLQEAFSIFFDFYSHGMDFSGSPDLDFRFGFLILGSLRRDSY